MPELFSVDIFPTLKLLGSAYGIYLVGLIWWRVQFSPIAKFPGPILAGATYWYEFYYNIICPGQCIFKIRELHEIYGPIIRINPHELHVNDPDFHQTLYAGGARKRNRDPWHTDSITMDGSILESPPHELHRKRRAALSPVFNMKSTRRLISLLDEKTAMLIGRLEKAKETRAVVNLTHALSALANDVIEEYCFGSNHNRLEHEDFDPSYYLHAKKAGATCLLFKHYPFSSLIRWIILLPDSITSKLGRHVADHVGQKKVIAAKVAEVQSSKSTSNPTIFHTLLESNLPPSELSTQRLIHEGVLVVTAGSYTVA